MLILPRATRTPARPSVGVVPAPRRRRAALPRGASSSTRCLRAQLRL